MTYLRPLLLPVLGLALAGSSLQTAAHAKPRPYLGVHRHPAAIRVTASGPAAEVLKANAAARVQPAADGFINANQIYAFTDGSLFEVYTTIGKVTDIALQPGERLVGAGPVAAGDTARWIIGDTTSGTGENQQVHILVKPTQPKLSTNLVINTDRRTYHIELTAFGTTYMAAVAWHYPQDALLAVKQQAEAEALKAHEPVAQGIDPTKLNFIYRIEGDNPSWRPTLVFDDGRHVFIELPPGIATTDLPPLFVLGTDGASELVNYRVKDNYFVVDRLFDVAELRLGDKHGQKIVRIRRTGAVKS